MAHIEFAEMIDRHRAFADPLRVLILRLLLERELCVCELVTLLGEPQYKVSRHLAVLKQAGLVAEWREGTWIHHEIAPTLSPEWRQALMALRVAWDQCPAMHALVAKISRCVQRQPGIACGDTPCEMPSKKTRRASSCMAITDKETRHE